MASIIYNQYNLYSPSIENKNVVSENKRVIPKKCECDGCNKKLMLTDFACKCEKYFCANHRFMDNHKCNYDYKSEGINNLKKQLVQVSGDKLDKI
jgi:predicted nucleic acid binding AN1-type Zn finger protein